MKENFKETADTRPRADGIPVTGIGFIRCAGFESNLKHSYFGDARLLLRRPEWQLAQSSDCSAFSKCGAADECCEWHSRHPKSLLGCRECTTLPGLLTVLSSWQRKQVFEISARESCSKRMMFAGSPASAWLLPGPWHA